MAPVLCYWAMVPALLLGYGSSFTCMLLDKINGAGSWTMALALGYWTMVLALCFLDYGADFMLGLQSWVLPLASYLQVPCA